MLLGVKGNKFKGAHIAMAKKGGAAGGSKHSKAKKPVQKTKKGSSFKALKKQETRQAVVSTEKKHGSNKPKVVIKKQRPSHAISDDFRNFDERMAASRVKKQQSQAALAAANAVVVAPSFVMAAPTFQFNKPNSSQEAPREVEGFHGFLSAMQQAPMAPQPSAPRDTRKPKVARPANVFAVLDDDEDSHPQPVAAVAVPNFMQPATFSFQTNTGTGATQNRFQSSFAAQSGGLTSLQRSIMAGSASTRPSPFAGGEIDPDL